MKTLEEIKQAVCLQVQKQEAIPHDLYPAGANLADIGMTWLDCCSLALALNDEFLVEIPDGAPEKWKTTDDIAQTVFSLLQQ